MIINGMNFGSISNVRTFDNGQNVYFADVQIDISGGDNFEILFYCATETDVAPTGQWVYQQIMGGNFQGEVTHLAPGVDPQTGLPPAPPSSDQNKSEAERRLAATDWVNQPDVYDPANTPHLTNRDAFIAYRSQVRAIAVNPVSGNLNWPTELAPVWSQA
jgi:hypothetical protein